MDITDALAFSRYANRALAVEPGLADFLAESRGRPFAWDDVRATLADVGAQDDPETHAIALRGLRRRLFLHTLVRDLTGLAPLTEVCGAMTQLAEVALESTVATTCAAAGREPRGTPQRG